MGIFLTGAKSDYILEDRGEVVIKYQLRGGKGDRTNRKKTLGRTVNSTYRFLISLTLIMTSSDASGSSIPNFLKRTVSLSSSMKEGSKLMKS